MPTTSQQSDQVLRCMEILGGNTRTRKALSAPGLDIWVDSRPSGGESGGGDIHYLSMCGSGRVTRVAVADVAGHGIQVDALARRLRKLLRKHINQLDQTRLAVALNREFSGLVDDSSFATVLLTTYFAPTDHLIVCNAGHPRPIWYSRRSGQWKLLDPHTPDMGPPITQEKFTYGLSRLSNLPLGVIEPTDYYQFSVKLDKNDIVLIYTDALTEATNPAGEALGEYGLLEVARQLDPDRPQDIREELLRAVDDWRDHNDSPDDQTLIVLRHNATDPPRLTVGQAMRSMARMIGLGRI